MHYWFWSKSTSLNNKGHLSGLRKNRFFMANNWSADFQLQTSFEVRFGSIVEGPEHNLAILSISLSHQLIKVK
jgi:hypothetical protein